MADPRFNFSFLRIDAEDVSVACDGTIGLPVVGIQGYVPSMSPQLHAAVALVNAGAATPTVGLGAAGNPLAGELMVVEPDGACTVQHEGYMYLPYNTTTPPVVGGFVAVDGTGKVQAAAAPTKAICWQVGVPDPHYIPLTGTPPLTALIKI